MHCANCGKTFEEKSRFCSYCGLKVPKRRRTLLIFWSITVMFISFYLLSNMGNLLHTNKTAIHHPTLQTSVHHFFKETSSLGFKRIFANDQPQPYTDLISQAQETVYTVLTAYNQGSGFLYNENGIVITNAHVVEGEVQVFVRTSDGDEFLGTVIGYSNETDIAAIQVPRLIGVQPFSLETANKHEIGEEVIALGSPHGLDNTATLGYITGKDYHFIIGFYQYNDLYQISAPIAEGSSGGPLISKRDKKIIAINAAKSLEDETVGFSIPLYTVQQLIQDWLDNPMSEDDVIETFYRAAGNWFFQSKPTDKQSFQDDTNSDAESDYFWHDKGHNEAGFTHFLSDV